jgi:hypothetical protein
MSRAAAFRDCLEDGDFRRMRTLFATVAPHLPQPQTDEQAEISLHMARTQTASLGFSLRAWSHKWLRERNLPSQLPDFLLPAYERLYPTVVDGVGIAVRATRPERVDQAIAVRTSMENAVLEMFADGVRDPTRVSARMMEARDKTLRQA